MSPGLQLVRCLLFGTLIGRIVFACATASSTVAGRCRLLLAESCLTCPRVSEIRGQWTGEINRLFQLVEEIFRRALICNTDGLERT
jgi:hypothetical protein